MIWCRAFFVKISYNFFPKNKNHCLGRHESKLLSHAHLEMNVCVTPPFGLMVGTPPTVWSPVPLTGLALPWMTNVEKLAQVGRWALNVDMNPWSYFLSQCRLCLIISILMIVWRMSIKCKFFLRVIFLRPDQWSSSYLVVLSGIPLYYPSLNKGNMQYHTQPIIYLFIFW